MPPKRATKNSTRLADATPTNTLPLPTPTNANTQQGSQKQGPSPRRTRSGRILGQIASVAAKITRGRRAHKTASATTTTEGAQDLVGVENAESGPSQPQPAPEPRKRGGKAAKPVNTLEIVAADDSTLDSDPVVPPVPSKTTTTVKRKRSSKRGPTKSKLAIVRTATDVNPPAQSSSTLYKSVEDVERITQEILNLNNTVLSQANIVKRDLSYEGMIYADAKLRLWNTPRDAVRLLEAAYVQQQPGISQRTNGAQAGVSPRKTETSVTKTNAGVTNSPASLEAPSFTQIIFPSAPDDQPQPEPVVRPRGLTRQGAVNLGQPNFSSASNSQPPRGTPESGLAFTGTPSDPAAPKHPGGIDWDHAPKRPGGIDWDNPPVYEDSGPSLKSMFAAADARSLLSANPGTASLLSTAAANSSLLSTGPGSGSLLATAASLLSTGPAGSSSSLPQQTPLKRQGGIDWDNPELHKRSATSQPLLTFESTSISGAGRLPKRAPPVRQHEVIDLTRSPSPQEELYAKQDFEQIVFPSVPNDECEPEPSPRPNRIKREYAVILGYPEGYTPRSPWPSWAITKSSDATDVQSSHNSTAPSVNGPSTGSSLSQPRGNGAAELEEDVNRALDPQGPGAGHTPAPARRHPGTALARQGAAYFDENGRAIPNDDADRTVQQVIGQVVNDTETERAKHARRTSSSQVPLTSHEEETQHGDATAEANRRQSFPGVQPKLKQTGATSSGMSMFATGAMGSRPAAKPQEAQVGPCSPGKGKKREREDEVEDPCPRSVKVWGYTFSTGPMNVNVALRPLPKKFKLCIAPPTVDRRAVDGAVLAVLEPIVDEEVPIGDKVVSAVIQEVATVTQKIAPRGAKRSRQEFEEDGPVTDEDASPAKRPRVASR